MLLIIVVITAVAVIMIGSRVQLTGRANPANLGCMSEQWLAEYARRT